MNKKIDIIVLTNMLDKTCRYIIAVIGVILLIVAFFTTSPDVIFPILKFNLLILAIYSFGMIIRGVYKKEYGKVTIGAIFILICMYGLFFYLEQ